MTHRLTGKDGRPCGMNPPSGVPSPPEEESRRTGAHPHLPSSKEQEVEEPMLEVETLEVMPRRQQGQELAQGNPPETIPTEPSSRHHPHTLHVRLMSRRVVLVPDVRNMYESLMERVG